MQPPFGSSEKRFHSLGYHPNLEVRSGTYKYPNIFPGCHSWNRSTKIVSKIPRWQRCLEMEEFSKRMGYRGDFILKQRKWINSINGPGWQNISFLSSSRGTNFLRSERFKETSWKFSVPGPGTYGKNHVPHTRKEEKTREKGFSFSILSPFDKIKSEPKSQDSQASYHLPPNIYTIKTFIDEFLSKRISKRGPYDLFTGPRFPRSAVSSGTFEKKTHTPFRKTDSKTWDHTKNSFKGKFLKCGKDSLVTTRMVFKDPAMCMTTSSNPAPNYYEPFPIAPAIRSNFPFDSSVKECRPSVKKVLLPPPGRYNPEQKKVIKGGGRRSAFLSKTKRTVPQPQKWSWFE